MGGCPIARGGGGGLRQPCSECRRARREGAGRDRRCRRPEWVWGVPGHDDRYKGTRSECGR